MKKIVTIIGARPQFIKAAPLSKALNDSKNFEEIILHTGQHFDGKMSDIFFNEMKIPSPKYRFNINNLNHGAMTGLMLKEIETVLISEKPDLVIVFGDTNSTLAGALAAKKLNLKLAHVEAGLRSFNNEMPEEINRILTDRISDYAFCPSEQSVTNLKNEGFDNFQTEIIKTGDIMLDALMMFADIAESHSNILDTLNNESYVLATIHRAENTNNLVRLKSIISALEILNKTIKVVLPLHPRTQKIMELAGIKTDLFIIEPVGYFDMLTLIKNCNWVMTDSGGLQKEAYFLKKFCITLRDQTEWIELINCGANVLVGADTDLIIEKSLEISEKKFNFPLGIYGNGQTSKQIVSHLETCI